MLWHLLYFSHKLDVGVVEYTQHEKEIEKELRK